MPFTFPEGVAMPWLPLEMKQDLQTVGRQVAQVADRMMCSWCWMALPTCFHTHKTHARAHMSLSCRCCGDWESSLMFPAPLPTSTLHSRGRSPHQRLAHLLGSLSRWTECVCSSSRSREHEATRFRPQLQPGGPWGSCRGRTQSLPL